MRSKISEALLAVVLLMQVAPPAAAQTAAARNAARAKLQEGARQLRAGEYADALRTFRSAHELVPSPKIFFNFGLAYDGLARYADALESFERFVAEAKDANPDNLGQARGEIESLRRKVGFVTVRCDRIGADVLVDGRNRGKTPLRTPVALDPGVHQLVVELDGKTRAQPFTVEAGARQDLVITLEAPVAMAPPALRPAPPPAPPVAGLTATPQPEAPAPAPLYRRPWFWVVVGSAVAAGTVAALLLGRRTEYPEPSLGRRQVSQ